MIGYWNQNSAKTCIWFPSDTSEYKWVTLCEPDFGVSKTDVIEDRGERNCSDCLRIAARIAEDKKELEKR